MMGDRNAASWVGEQQSLPVELEGLHSSPAAAEGVAVELGIAHRVEGLVVQHCTAPAVEDRWSSLGCTEPEAVAGAEVG